MVTAVATSAGSKKATTACKEVRLKNPAAQYAEMEYRCLVRNVMMGIARTMMDAQRYARRRPGFIAKTAMLQPQVSAKRCAGTESTWDSLPVMMGISLMRMAAQPNAKKRYFGTAMVALPLLQIPASIQLKRKG